jgi:hypothetical protein
MAKEKNLGCSFAENEAKKLEMLVLQVMSCYLVSDCSLA